MHHPFSKNISIKRELKGEVASEVPKALMNHSHKISIKRELREGVRRL